MVFLYHFFMIVLLITSITTINAANSPVISRLRPAKSKISSRAVKFPIKKSKCGQLNQRFLVAGKSHNFIGSNSKTRIDASKVKSEINNQLNTCIIVNIQNKKNNEIITLLSEIKDINNMRGKSNETFLHRAVSEGNGILVEKLLAMRKKININARSMINARDMFGYTPLHIAIFKHATESAQENTYFNILHSLIKDIDIEINAQDNEGKTPLHIVFDIKWKDIFLKYTTVLMLCESGADVNKPDNTNITPLLRSIFSKNDNILARMLINVKNANPNIELSSGMTPLHLAIYHGNKNLVEELIKKGANINAKAFITSQINKGITPLALAKNNNLKEIATLLKKYGGKT